MVDAVVFGIDLTKGLEILLIKRNEPPFVGHWALPGGHVDIDEEVDAAVHRELKEETSVEGRSLEEVGVFSRVGRDPRGRTVSIAYYALVKPDQLTLKAGSDADDAQWFLVNDLPALAFDHAEIVEAALFKLRTKVRDQPIGFDLLPEKFTLSQLQAVYEIVLSQKLDKRHFRRDILGMNILDPLDEYNLDVAYRPPQLYRFNRRRYLSAIKKGFRFEL